MGLKLAIALENVRKTSCNVAKAFSEILARSPNLWDADPLLEARVFCMEKYGRMTCSRNIVIDVGPAQLDTYLRALEEARKAGIELGFFGLHGITVEWGPTNDLVEEQEALARILASELKIPIEVSASYTPASNDRGHVAGNLRIATCIPVEWELDSLLRRLQMLLEALEGAGYGITRMELDGGKELSPYRLERKYMVCAGAIVWYSERRSKLHETVIEEPDEYMMVLDEEISLTYPADPDDIEAHKPHRLYWYLPNYKPPWPCPKDLDEALHGTSYEVIMTYTCGALIQANNKIFQIDCDSIPADNTIRTLNGSKTDLLNILKIIIINWTKKVLRDSQLELYTKAVQEATSFEELIEIARETEDSI